MNFAPRPHVPTLMANGEDDLIVPYEAARKPLFDLLGAPAGDKRHARLAGGHIVSDRIALMQEVLGWLDRHLGPVESWASNAPVR